MRLIDADALKKDIETEWLTPQTKIAFYKIIDDTPTTTPTLPTEVRKALEVLKGMKHGKWIPVSEKLPFNYVLCLFCDKEGNIFYGHRKSNNLWYEEYQPGTISDVVAWQELPEPYKEEGAE